MIDKLIIEDKEFKSRLFIGTGKHRSLNELEKYILSSESEMITVAIRRLDLENKSSDSDLLQMLKRLKINILPNTAGCKNLSEIILTCELARELTETNWVKLEAILDKKFLLPDPIMTLEAASSLIDKGFKVLPYINADPALAKRLEDIGCATVMPLASPIGSGNGIKNEESIKIIIDQSKIPVIVDAGIAVPSDASKMLEIGADAVLVNTAIAQASKPNIMAKAFKLGVEAGRNSFLAGRIDSKPIASPSSPEINLIDA
ncbi:MAG: thiazole synthase [Rickettsiales bacterium]|nr:thiazole synthase [Rickettsiales bacterium]